jgi:outer membrane protein assembly factor BamB
MKLLFSILLCLSSFGSDLTTVTVDESQKILTVKMHGTSHEFPIGAPQGMSVEGSPSFYSGEGLHLIFTSVADHEVATTLVLAIDAKGKKLWSFDTEAFNNSPPLIEKKHVYLAGMGKVYKLDAKTGSLAWRHEGLYENKKYSFNGGDAISRKKDVIIFSPTVHVKDSSGKLLEVTK